MAMTDLSVRASAAVSLSATFAPEGVILASTPVASTVVNQTASGQMTALTYGTTSGKGDLVVCQDRTLSATTGYTYDLYTGTDLKDVDHNTAAFRYVRFVGVFIYAVGASTTAGVRIGGAASNAWPAFFADATDKQLIYYGGPPYMAGRPAGTAVGATTKNFLIENLESASVSVRIIICGSSV